jgi:hypothetical protein
MDCRNGECTNQPCKEDTDCPFENICKWETEKCSRGARISKERRAQFNEETRLNNEYDAGIKNNDDNPPVKKGDLESLRVVRATCITVQ